RRSPAKGPRLMISPSRPTTISSTSRTLSIGPITEISSRSWGSSCFSTGKKRGSRNAAEIALEVTALNNGSTARIDPMQPRNSPARVRRVTNAPAGRRRSSSKSSAFHCGARWSRTISIDVRASCRSLFRCSSLSTVDQHQVANVHNQAGPLSDDEHGVVSVDCVSGGDQSSQDGEVPENERNVALLPPFGGDPLHDEPRAEDELAEQTEGEPEPVEGHASSRTL